MRTETVEAIRRLVNAGGFRQTENVLRHFWAELASHEARELLADQLTHHAPISRNHQLLSTRLRALDRAIAEGIDATFAGYDAATEAIISVLNAPDWDKVREAVEAHRQCLFPEVADFAFADLLMQPSSPDEESQVLGGWNLIEQCRALGVEAAFEAQQKPSRGIVLGPEVAKDLAASESPEDLQRRLEASPEIASRLARRREGESQWSQWLGGGDYLKAMNAFSARGDLSQRIETCREGLAGIDREKLPLVWAMVALDLADALRNQVGYARSAPMAEVIALYRDALSILTPQGEPDQFAHAQHYLGDALLLNSDGDQEDNAEAAVLCYETALGLQRAAVESVPWAMASAHLGEALLRRSHGDPSIDVDRAVDLLKQVIGVLEKRRDDPALLASARLTLAAALIRCISGSQDENLRNAARQLRNAMEDVDPNAYPDLWAMANTQLGDAFLARARADLPDSKELLKQAEGCFRAALSCADTAPAVRARAHAGLGWALGDQAEGGASTVAETILEYEAAIELYEGMGSAADMNRGIVHRNLGLLHAKLSAEETTANVAAAERHFRAALVVFSPTDYPVERRDTLRCIGAMYFNAERWTEALACLDEAMALSASVLAGRYTEPGKEEEVAKNRQLYGQTAYCRVRLGSPGEALQTLERGKARMLAEALAWKEVGSSVPSAEDQHALCFARDEIMRLEAQARQARASRDAERYRRFGRQLCDAYRHLASLRPAAQGPTAMELNLEGMLAQIPESGALVVPIVTTKGSAVLVVPAGAGGVSEEHVVELGSLRVSALADMLNSWLNPYLEWLRNPASFGHVLEALDTLASALWKCLMGPVQIRLRKLGVAEHAPIVIMPSSWLGLLPLHAARRQQADGRWCTFGEEFVVSYAPSMYALSLCRRRLGADERRGQTLLAVSNPTGDLQFADAEALAISALFTERDGSPNAVRLLASKAATRLALIRAVAGRHYLHFACHAEFRWTDVAESGLRLAGGESLRLADVLSPAVDLRSSRLVTLSACETGMAEFRTIPDEFVGLPGAFLEAGAPTVISSLWPVDDASTRFLMAELYRVHLGGVAVAAALQCAQRWLSEATAAGLGLAQAYRRLYEESGWSDARALENWQYYDAHPNVIPFAHPFFWAGFTVAGCPL